MLLTVDKNGKDATDPGVRPEEHRPVGLRAAARRPPPGRARTGPPAARRPGRQDRRDPRGLGRGLEVVLRRDLDGPHVDDRAAVREPGVQPERLPVLHRQRRDERELPLVHVRRRRRRRRLEPGGDPGLQRPDDRRVQRGHVPHPQGQQAPGRGVQGPDLPAREGSKDLLTAYGGMPARPEEQDAFFETLQNQSRGRHRSSRSRSTGPWPRRASTTPTCRTSSRTCRRTTSRSTC